LINKIHNFVSDTFTDKHNCILSNGTGVLNKRVSETMKDLAAFAAVVNILE
jgi:hypothetical protein